MKLRKQFKLNKGDVDTLADFSQNKYLRIEKEEQEAALSDLTAIAAVYNLKVYELLNPQLKIPKVSSLPQSTQDRIKKNAHAIGIRKHGKWNLNDNIIVILSKYHVGDTFANSEIINQLTGPISEHMAGKSIEWDKGSLKGLVIDSKEKTPTKMTGDHKTKPEKIYRLAIEITDEVREKAQEKIYLNGLSGGSEV